MENYERQSATILSCPKKKTTFWWVFGALAKEFTVLHVYEKKKQTRIAFSNSYENIFSEPYQRHVGQTADGTFSWKHVLMLKFN